MNTQNENVESMTEAEYQAILAECGEAEISVEDARNEIVPPLPDDMRDED